MSSLAAQLAKNASLNSDLLLSRRKRNESYLFSGKETDLHDLETIHGLAVNGLLQLASVNPAFRAHQDIIFSNSVKNVDRTLLSVEANADLDKHLTKFLPMLGPYLMDAPSGKVIEWLVRRFRIHEFNVDHVLALFWPYHESPHFAKMLTILHIKEQSKWQFLLPYKAATQSVRRLALVTEMLKNTDVARFVASLLPDALKRSHVHRTLLVFNAATLHDFIIHSQSLDEGTMAFLLPALLTPLQKHSSQDISQDSILGSYVLLSALSRKSSLAAKALKVIISSIASSAHHVATQQFISAAISVCEPQDELKEFSEETISSFLHLPNVEEETTEALVWSGVEKFISPMLSILLQRLLEPAAISFIESLVTSPKLPKIIVQRMAALLINKLIDQNSAADESGARRILSMIYQRHPSIVHDVGTDSGSGSDSIQELLQSLSNTNQSRSTTESPGSNRTLEAVTLSANIEPASRRTAVMALVEILESSVETDASEAESIESALVARVYDTEAQVLEALYSNSSLINSVLAKKSNAYLDVLESSLCNPASKPARSILRIHLAYLISHFCPAIDVHTQYEAFLRIVFPFLLFSKSRHRATEAVWDLIAASRDPDYNVPGFELLAGCAEIWTTEKSKQNTIDFEAMSRLNTTLASRIAENIFISDDYPRHLKALLDTLRSRNNYTRVFGHLITRALLSRLSGTNQLDAAHRILEAMQIDRKVVIENTVVDEPDFANPEYATELEKTIVLKPSNRLTLYSLQISILALIAQLPRPFGIVIDWFSNQSVKAAGGTGETFVKTIRTVYGLAQSLNAHSMSLLRILFNNLEADSLAFLAGIWTGSSDQDLCLASLRHASAFLQAHCSADQPLDFQTVLPSLVVAVQTLDRREQEAALECITQLVIPTDKRFSAVYCLDTIYGSGSSTLQFLNRSDYQRYASSLVEHKAHLLADPAYIYTLHHQELTRVAGEKKKDATYKDNVLCYLLSHVNGASSPQIQKRILNLVDDISHGLKAELLLPLLRVLVEDTPAETLASRFGTNLESIAGSVVSSLDLSVAGSLNEQDNALWSVYLTSLAAYLQTGALSLPRVILMNNLRNGLFTTLTLERKIAVSTRILAIGASDVDMYQDCKKLLNDVLEDAPLIIHLLKCHQLSAPADSPRASKRIRTEEGAGFPDDSLPSLTLLMEVLGTKSLPGSLDLVSCLLETLHNTVQYALSTQADLSFVQQLSMSAIENAADKITEVPNLTPSAIRLDILVDLIRAANNPQVFNQALLLMAGLSRLAPESVLHNVMPVFTFMGSNVFHRDDTYSFRVVQKTIDSIIPVMVTSLKTTHSDRLLLNIAAKDLLGIFADAANHVPRHRRTNFFAHLADVLGPQDFLAPLLMLLTQKPASRIVRQSAEEVKNSLSLHLSVLQHYPMSLQIFVLAELLRESLRLINRLHDPGNAQPTFLNVLQTDDSASASAVQKRLALSLIALVSHAVDAFTPSSEVGSNGEAHGELVSLLLDIATAQGVPVSEKDDIAKAARSVMAKLLRVMPAAYFVTAVQSMLESEDNKIQAGALDLLSEHLPRVAAKTRQEVSPTIEKILASMKKLLTQRQEGPLATSAFAALKTICLTTTSGEESPLMNFIAVMLLSLKSEKAMAPAIAVLPALTIRLGPRLIPHFREIVTQCVAVLRRSQGSAQQAQITQDALSVLQNLLRSIPSFWTVKELAQVIGLHLDLCGSPNTESTMAPLVKAIAKRAPPKTVLLTMNELWPPLHHSAKESVLTGYFDMLKKALHAAHRPIVLEHLRPMFKVFLEALEVVGPEAETIVILSFVEMVIKLNESSFKPIFRRLYDWAFTSDAAPSRKTSFCRVYTALLEFFKGLMTPYMSMLIQPFVDTLKATSSTDDQDLWLSLIACFSSAFRYDNGAFWRDDKLRQVVPTLIDQIAVCIRFDFSGGKHLLSECLITLTECVDDDTLLKSINLNVLMHTRSEDPLLRLFALSCSESLWRTHGGKFLGFVAETTSFMAECAEDENDNVVKQSHQLKNAVESVAGKVDGL